MCSEQIIGHMHALGSIKSKAENGVRGGKESTGMGRGAGVGPWVVATTTAEA